MHRRHGLGNLLNGIGLCLVAVLVGAVLTGCGGSDNPDSISATGVVTYNDKPVPNVSVVFSPKDGGRTATGLTDEDGRFDLTTFEDGDGAILGEHTVTLTPITETPEGDEASIESYAVPTETKGPIPQKYGDAEQSGLTATVKADGPNDFTFKLVD